MKTYTLGILQQNISNRMSHLKIDFSADTTENAAQLKKWRPDRFSFEGDETFTCGYNLVSF